MISLDGTKFNPYSILNISKSADQDIIRKAYYKLALLYHPDRNNDPESSEKFKILGQAYEILSNSEKKELFDTTGFIDDNLLQTESFFRDLFKKVSLSDINYFKSCYVNSVEEYEDLLVYYLKFHGNMEMISENMFFSSIEEEKRYFKILEKAINRNIIPKLGDLLEKSKYEKNLKKRKRTANKEANEAEKLANELNIQTQADLENKILQKRLNFDNNNTFIETLEKKYSKKKKGHY